MLCASVSLPGSGHSALREVPSSPPPLRGPDRAGTGCWAGLSTAGSRAAPAEATPGAAPLLPGGESRTPLLPATSLKDPCPRNPGLAGAPCPHSPHPGTPPPQGTSTPRGLRSSETRHRGEDWGEPRAALELGRGALALVPTHGCSPWGPTPNSSGVSVLVPCVGGGFRDPREALPSSPEAAASGAVPDGAISITPFAPSFPTSSLVNFPRAPISGAGFTALCPGCKVRVKVTPGTWLLHKRQVRDGWSGGGAKAALSLVRALGCSWLQGCQRGRGSSIPTLSFPRPGFPLPGRREEAEAESVPAPRIGSRCPHFLAGPPLPPQRRAGGVLPPPETPPSPSQGPGCQGAPGRSPLCWCVAALSPVPGGCQCRYGAWGNRALQAQGAAKVPSASRWPRDASCPAPRQARPVLRALPCVSVGLCTLGTGHPALPGALLRF